MSDQVSAPASAPSTPEPSSPSTASAQIVDGKPAGSPTEGLNTAASEMRRIKLKIDGQEHELPEDEVIRRAQKSSAADKRMSEAAQARKQAEEFIHLLKTDPRKALSHPAIGHDVRKFAEEFLADTIKQELMSPEQRKIQEMQAKLRQYQEQEESVKRETATKQQQEVVERTRADYDKRISEALLSAGLPKSPATVKKAAQLMYSAVKQGYEIDVKDVIPLVRESYINDIKELFGASDGDTLLQILGEDVANKIRKSDLKRLQSSRSAPQARPAATPTSAPSEKKMGTDEWMEHIKRKFSQA